MSSAPQPQIRNQGIHNSTDLILAGASFSNSIKNESPPYPSTENALDNIILPPSRRRRRSGVNHGHEPVKRLKATCKPADLPTRKPVNLPSNEPANTLPSLDCKPKSTERRSSNAACTNFLKPTTDDVDSSIHDRARRKRRKKSNDALNKYSTNILGIDPEIDSLDDVGKSLQCEPTSIILSARANDEAVVPKSDPFGNFKKAAREESKRLAQSAGIPTVTELYNGGFGNPTVDLSFTQEASFETILFQVLKRRQYISQSDLDSLCKVHVLIDHLCKTMERYENVDFSRLREYDLDYASRDEIPQERINMFMACLFRYDLSVANVYRYAGNNYTAGYRNMLKQIASIQGMVDEDLITQYIRVMTVGAPSHFNAESTRENAMLHWREGNHPSIAKNMDLVMKAMTKLEKHNFVIPIRSWIARFVPHIFFTPHHILTNKGNRLIFDASRRYTPLSIPVNRMTSTKRGVELDCEYGDVLSRLLVRIWNLRITYPTMDIILHANDVKSCFRQMKHHPDVMGAFSYIIGGLLFLSCGLTFGSDFSPQTWEVVRRMVEQLATNLFETEGLVEKHRTHLDKLSWHKKLGKCANPTQAHKSEMHQGVLDETGEPAKTPHHLFVDDDVYADVFDIGRIEQTIACGIEALFRLLGESDLARRQDPVSWDKLEQMTIHYRNKILGLVIDTRKMTTSIPPEYVSKVLDVINSTWHGGQPTRKSFQVKEAETLAGQLTHIANIAKWLKHLMSHVYSSLAASLKSNKAYLVCTNKHFREQIKRSKMEAIDETSELERSFAQAEAARKVHNLKKTHWIVPTLYEELQLIKAALEADWIPKASPIAHLIPSIPDTDCDGDSSLDAAGGWSISMRFWWYIEWPQKIRERTLRFVKDGKSGKLIDINALEYATVLINYAACIYYWVIEENIKRIPYPTCLIRADNKSAESWAIKGCKRSLTGRRLGRLQCALMINNPVGLDTDYINTKLNVIADRISRHKKETNILLGFDTLCQEFPQLKCCRRFHPSKDLISWVTDALLSEELANPLAKSPSLLKNPGKIIS